MTLQAKDLANKLQAFNDRVIAVVERISEADWNKQSREEDWTVGVVARHIGAGHYSVIDLADMIVAGRPLPDFTMGTITQMANAHAAAHADCTKAEVESILRKNGKKLVDTVAGWSDAQVNVKAFLPAFDNEVSAGQIIEWVVFESAGGHLESIEKTLST